MKFELPTIRSACGDALVVSVARLERVDALELDCSTLSPSPRPKLWESGIDQARPCIAAGTGDANVEVLVSLSMLFLDKPSMPATWSDVAFDRRTPCMGRAAISHLNAPTQRRCPDLLKALKSRRLQAVQAALEDDPGGATTPFWDHEMEPPLCAALRCHCTSAVVSLLLAAGADVHEENVRGQTPLSILRSSGASLFADYDGKAIETLLLAHGAVPMGEPLPHMPAEHPAFLELHDFFD